ncbi:MAG: FAD-dependent thymidylate synthase [Myxococcales bacterium]|nr:FAD-dependent thymidylate synthase [Myxococcales bacterium]
MKQTRRETVSEIDELVGTEFPVLDHGFIRIVDYMGSDGAIVQAARVSYGTGTKTASTDRGLIRYLMRHQHTSPFEMCEIKLHIKLPIFIARQWIRHRTANVNEYSGRYSVLDNEFYIPEEQHISGQGTENKQGRESVSLSGTEAKRVKHQLQQHSEASYSLYEALLGTDAPKGAEASSSIARELARLTLPTNIYTQWYWKVDLHNLLHFLALRMDTHAQYEIRAYADVIGELVAKWVPHTWEAFQDYRVRGAHLSQQELKVLRDLLEGTQLPEEGLCGLSVREVRQFRQKLGLRNDN